jgi:hypothetical protein
VARAALAALTADEDVDLERGEERQESSSGPYGVQIKLGYRRLADSGRSA